MILAAGTGRIASCSITTIIVGNVTVSPHGNKCRAVPNVDTMLKATVSKKRAPRSEQRKYLDKPSITRARRKVNMNI